MTYLPYDMTADASIGRRIYLSRTGAVKAARRHAEATGHAVQVFRSDGALVLRINAK